MSGLHGWTGVGRSLSDGLGEGSRVYLGNKDEAVLSIVVMKVKEIASLVIKSQP